MTETTNQQILSIVIDAESPVLTYFVKPLDNEMTDEIKKDLRNKYFDIMGKENIIDIDYLTDFGFGTNITFNNTTENMDKFKKLLNDGKICDVDFEGRCESADCKFLDSYGNIITFRSPLSKICDYLLERGVISKADYIKYSLSDDTECLKNNIKLEYEII